MNSNGKHAVDEVDEQQELFDLCLKHLSDTHTQLWSRAWNISDPKSQRAAAEWLASEISAVFA